VQQEGRGGVSGAVGKVHACVQGGVMADARRCHSRRQGSKKWIEKQPREEVGWVCSP
jgi:hypothetical protein